MGDVVRNRRADATRRADLAWKARVAGGTWTEAAEVAGYANGDNARRAVRRHYGTLPDPEELRDVWRARGEVMWRQSVRDMADRQPGAVTAAVRIMSAAVALDGLAAATKVDIGIGELIEKLDEAMRREGL